MKAPLFRDKKALGECIAMVVTYGVSAYASVYCVYRILTLI